MEQKNVVISLTTKGAIWVGLGIGLIVNTFNRMKTKLFTRKLIIETQEEVIETLANEVTELKKKLKKKKS